MSIYKIRPGSIIMGFILATGFSAGPVQASIAQEVNKKLARTTVPFVKNEGQMDAAVAFRASTFGGQVFVTHDNKLVYDLPARNQKGDAVSWAFREVFVSSEKTGTQVSKPAGLDVSHVAVSSFRGSDPAKWQRKLTSFNSVTVGEQFPGIRVNLKATGNNVEKLFYVAPGAKPELIGINIEGVNGVAINQAQQLVLATDLGDVTFTAPVAYQLIDGKQHTVQVAYALNEKSRSQYGFRVGHYNPDYELVIDPLLASTYVGGVNGNPAWTGNYDEDIAYSVLPAGDVVYVGGVTQSTDFPIVLGYDDTPDALGRPDGFIAQFSSDLSTLYRSTYFGTDNYDRVSAIAMDTDGTIVAVGQAGYGFPVTAGAYVYSGVQPAGGGFVAKFSADLSTLIASAVVTPGNYPTEVAIGNGGIYFGGAINNPGLPVTEGALQPFCSCLNPPTYGLAPFEGFAGKISSDLTTLNAMTYLGGDNLTSITVAPDSSVYYTNGYYPVVTGSGMTTGHVGHLDADLTTSLGLLRPETNTANRHYYNDLAIGDGYVVVVGDTYANDLPVSANAFDTTCGTANNCGPGVVDGFVAKYSMDLQTLLAMTYFGGAGTDVLSRVALDNAGNIIATGRVSSSSLPTTSNAHDRSCGSNGNCGGYDVFVARFSPDLSQLLYGSYLGGAMSDRPYDMNMAADGTIYIAGRTTSADYPTTSGAFDRTFAGGSTGSGDSDAFISQLDVSGSGGTDPNPTPDPVPDPDPVNVDPVADAGSDQVVGSRARVYLDGTGSSDSDGSIVSYRWTQVSGKDRSLRNANQAVANFRAPRLRRGRTYTLVFKLEVTDDRGATSTDRVTIEVR